MIPDLNCPAMKIVILIALIFSLCYLAELYKQDALRAQGKLIGPVQTQEELLHNKLVPYYKDVVECTPWSSVNSTRWSM